MDQVMDIITAQNLTYDQKLLQLAQAAENSVDPLHVSDKFRYYFEKGALCDMNEGKAPYRPRYILADFQQFVQNGSEFLRLKPPEDLDDLLTSLCILYGHIPSVTGRPVYVGNLDKLIDPFLEGVSDQEAFKKIKRFLNFIDRTVANGYCHANLGPEATRAGRLILDAEKELQNAVPNFTLKYDPDITPDDFGEQAVLTALSCASPAFCNHRIHRQTYSGDYGIVSCFNILPVRGGGYCLSRVVLPRLADLASGVEQFLEELLPEALQALGEYMNERVRFMVEESHFFDTSFLVKEGLIDPDRFVGMFGVAGLCECVNTLLKDHGGFRYGRDEEANDLGDRIMCKIHGFVEEFPAVYSKLTGGRYLLHAQAGLAPQKGVTPGVRIVVGDEPDNIMDHIRHSARFHRFFPTGVSDIFPVETTARNNPAAILDLVKGAFSIDDKYLSFYIEDGDLIRITGYLAKRSEMEKFSKGVPVLQDTSHGAVNNYRNNHVADRKVRF
ncbi:MAG: YjjI family glycine radical enzyme [bacterium]